MYRWIRTSSTTRLAGSALVLLVALGCATAQRPASQGKNAVEQRNWDAAVYYYLEALAREPDNPQYRMALIRVRQKAGQEHFQRGLAFKELGRLAAARSELQLALQLDPTHQFAEQELAKVEKDLDILSRPDGEQTLEQLKAKAREAKVQPPLLDPRSKEPITLNFPKSKPVKEIYQAMAKAYGFNVLFDPKLKDDKLSIELADVTAEQALEIVMQAAGHFYKVLDEHTILVAEDTPQNRREYEDLVIKTFFLSNADVKEVDKLLRSLIEARRLATNEQLNAITLRDTADKVAIAEKLIGINDKAKAEVLIDVELLQISHNKETDIGTPAVGLLPSPSGSTRPRSATAMPASSSTSSTRSPARRWSITVPNIFHQADQVDQRGPDPRPAPAAHHRGREGVTRDRRPGADPGDQLQHLQHRRFVASSRSPPSSTRTSASRSTSSRGSTTTGRSPSRCRSRCRARPARSPPRTPPPSRSSAPARSTP